MNANDVAASFAAVTPVEQAEEFSSKKVSTSDPNLMMDGLMRLLTILSAREARLEQQERAVLEAAEKRDIQIRKANKDWNRNILLTQKNCHHRKGYWKGGPGPLTVDYAVYMHTFINMKREAKCRICKMTWRPEDTKDFLIIHGQQVQNHTGIGWNDSIQGKVSVTGMIAQSTDKPSSSEAPLMGQLPDEVTTLLEGRPPDFIAQLLSSPEARAFLERTATKK